MAINKKLIHFKTFANFNSQKLSANEANTKYTTGISGTETSGNPDILYQSICFIKDTQQIWTHGQIYNASADNRLKDANVQAVDTEDVLDDVNVDYATKTYVDEVVGDINSVLESIING